MMHGDCKPLHSYQNYLLLINNKLNVIFRTSKTIFRVLYRIRMTLQDFPDNSYNSKNIIPISVDWKEGSQYDCDFKFRQIPVQRICLHKKTY